MLAIPFRKLRYPYQFLAAIDSPQANIGITLWQTMTPQDYLVIHFSEISNKDRSLPLYNPMLTTELTALRKHGQYQIGIMITPCHYYLLATGKSLSNLTDSSNQRVKLALPSASYPFRIETIPDAGPVAICRLNLSTCSFSSQQSAMLKAEKILDALMLETSAHSALETKAKAEVILLNRRPQNQFDAGRSKAISTHG